MPVASQHITCDSALLQQFQQSPNYDYNGSLGGVGQHLIAPKVHEPDIPIPGVDGMVLRWVFIAIAALVLIFLLYKYRIVLLDGFQSFFGKRTNQDTEADPTDEDTIYGIDFDAEIAAAQGRGDHSRVVRLIYLRTLRWLSDRTLIEWQPSYTPWQYSRQVTDQDFKWMTDTFMRVRYGKFNADQAMAQRMQQCSQQVIAAHEAAIDPSTDQKGGDA